MAPQKLSGLSSDCRHAVVSDLLTQSGLSGAKLLKTGTPQIADLSAAKSVLPDDQVICIGDAALARDPISSHGLVYALRSAAQAVAAAQSYLDPRNDGAAATDYLQTRHAADRHAAILATARAYGDQCRHDTRFWRQSAMAGVPKVQATNMPTEHEPLALDCTNAPVPHLGVDGITWAEGLAVRSSGYRFVTCGPYSATDIQQACASPATARQIETRLARVSDAQTALWAVSHLMSIGALVAADHSAAARQADAAFPAV